LLFEFSLFTLDCRKNVHESSGPVSSHVQDIVLSSCRDG
jgi:hypothetical protein